MWGDRIEATVMPVMDHRPDILVILLLLKEWGVERVVMETPGMRPGQSTQSGMTTGTNWGIIYGGLVASHIPLEEISPQKWKKALGLIKSTPKGQLKPTTKEKKEASIALCKQLYPNVDLRANERCKVAHDGKAEAILMLEYVTRRGK